MAKSYTLPTLLAAALSTNRGELAQLWAKQQEDEEKRNLGFLLADLLEDRVAALGQLESLTDRLTQLRQASQAASEATMSISARLRGADLSEDLEETHE